jgi:hypothetical protein
MSATLIHAFATADGLELNGQHFRTRLPLKVYQHALGLPTETLDAGAPAPFGHRNNQVQIFGSTGIYLTEHHASRLIESVNFIFDPAESPFPISRSFGGTLRIDCQLIQTNMREDDLDKMQLTRDLPGKYSLGYDCCWIGIYTKRRRATTGKRKGPRYVVRVSVCLK